MNKIQKIGVIGAGTMGAGIAQVSSQAGHEVIVVDSTASAGREALLKLESLMERLVQKGKITAEKAQQLIRNIEWTNQFEALGGCGLVIEAIVEDLGIKKNVFATLENLVDENTVLASNTSSLSITALAAACRFPGRVLGMHFFNPAPLMALVEVIPGIQTLEDTTRRAYKLLENWGKTPVLAKDTPGFIVNRVARPYYSEALRIFEEGIAGIREIDHAMTKIGQFPMGPFTLMDFIGNDVNFAVTENMFHSYYFEPRYKPSIAQKRLVEAGYLGKKNNKGWYDYPSNSSNFSNFSNFSHIYHRILIMLINEAAEALRYGIASQEDIETAMAKGANYPESLFKLADQLGIPRCVSMMDNLYNHYREERYRCSGLLRQMAATGRNFTQYEPVNHLEI